MKILYIEKGKKKCNYYGDMIHSLSINNIIHVQGNMKHENILQKIKEFNPDIVLVGFTITDTGGGSPKLNLNNISIPLYIILNKEYDVIEKKLTWIKSIHPPPKKVFTVHHEVEKYQNSCNIPFVRIMWSANDKIFKKYDDKYLYDLFFSGVMRKEQTSNLRNKIYKILNKLNKYVLLTNIGIFENNKMKGNPYKWNTKDYAINMNRSKIVLTTTGPADLVGTRYFEIMATNKALIMCNRMPVEVYEDILIDKFNCVMFNDENDFIEQCKYYLEHEDERIKIVNQAYNYFLEKHTWGHKIKHLLDNL